MSFSWCHGPKCHTSRTTDRVRGSKGSKVLRTRKIKQSEYQKSMYGNGGGNIWDYFCSHNCHMDFCHKHAEQIIRIEPRPTPLETPIHDPERIGNGYGGTTITLRTKEPEERDRVDTYSNVG